MVLGVFFVSFGEITELFFALRPLKFDGGKNSSESRFSEIIIFLACSVSVKHLLMFCMYQTKFPDNFYKNDHLNNLHKPIFLYLFQLKIIKVLLIDIIFSYYL
jgi:hypothetical protein